MPKKSVVTKKKARKLTPKEAAFAREYPVDCNGTQAAIRAGYSPRTANEQAVELLARPVVREAIDKAIRERAERTKVDADWVVLNFRNLYLESLAKGDGSTAVRCLENLGKHVGIYLEHNKQKQYTVNDVDRLKEELRQAGFDFTRTNAPTPTLPPPIQLVPVLSLPDCPASDS